MPQDRTENSSGWQGEEPEKFGEAETKKGGQRQNMDVVLKNKILYVKYAKVTPMWRRLTHQPFSPSCLSFPSTCAMFLPLSFSERLPV